MSDVVREQVRLALEKMDSKMPTWLEENKEPQFEYIERGNEGPTVVMLHGLFGALSNWDSILPLMEKYARCIALHFPILTGHNSEVKVKALAAFAEYFIRSKNLDKVILCGNSLGGHVALRVALASPELVEMLVLSGSSGLYEHTADTLPVRPNEKFIRDHMKRVFYSDEFITDAAVNEILSILSKRSNHLNLIHAARSAKKDNLQKILNQVQAPTLLLWGENDEVTTLEVARIFESLIPDAKLATVAGCGHAPMIEHPEWFAEQVQLFFKSKLTAPQK